MVGSLKWLANSNLSICVVVVVTIVDLPKSVLFPVVMGVVVSDDIIPAAVVGDHVCCCCC